MDINNLPIPGGVIIAALGWAALAGFALGPVAGQRTIEKSGWPERCQVAVEQTLAAQMPQAEQRPSMDCSSLMGPLMGHDGLQLCHQGGNQLFDLLSYDPMAAQKQALRDKEEARIRRLASRAPSQCACSAKIVAADRWQWGLHAGTARLMGGPDNLEAQLQTALHSPACANILEN